MDGIATCCVRRRYEARRMQLTYGISVATTCSMRVDMLPAETFIDAVGETSPLKLLRSAKWD